MLRSIGRLTPETTAFFVCDIQSKFAPHIHQFKNVILATNHMMNVCNELKIPIIVTEQYPKGLGHTVSELDVSKHSVFEKTKFSMFVPEVEKKLKELNTKSIVISGIESHVCVQQTSLDLLEKGYEVHLLEDAISSQFPNDRKVAIERVRQSGGFITTTSSVMLELVKDASHPNFKNVSKTLKQFQDERAQLPSSL
ncbi:hypothetical protein CYY_004862 [Polysphondylium violaceum]|uniref:Isochorismatase-like domain-containing protein n=1 Tax=Polysphondylium violaceum TaxID=133409 RepID=A0A8J4PV76_9MYCE|nr:hypothetical protein CYY_004862 [Polysphondylium violaceum]